MRLGREPRLSPLCIFLDAWNQMGGIIRIYLSGHTSNHNLGHGIAPIICSGRKVSNTVNTRMYMNEVYVTLPARIKAFAAADSWWARDVHAQFIVRFSAGVVSGGEICDRPFGAGWPCFAVYRKETVVCGDQHRGDTDMIEPSTSFHGQSHRLTRREDRA